MSGWDWSGEFQILRATPGLVEMGSEMCIRDSYNLVPSGQYQGLYFGLGVSQGAVSAFETFGFGVSPVIASGGDGGVNCGGLWCEAGDEREVCESVGVTNTCTTDAGLEFVLCSDDGEAGAK